MKVPTPGSQMLFSRLSDVSVRPYMAAPKKPVSQSAAVAGRRRA